MIGVVKRSFVSMHFPSLLALVIKYTQRPSGPQKIVSVKIDLCQRIYVYKDKWEDCWESRRRSFLVKKWWLEAFVWKQNWDSSYSLWEHRLVVVLILWRCPEDKKRHLGMGVFLVRQVLEKGDGRKWTELPTCTKDWTCGQTVQAALLRQATPPPEARDKNWPDGQLPRKLTWESCAVESFLGLLPLSLPHFAEGMPLGIQAVVITRVNKLTCYGNYKKWVNVMQYVFNLHCATRSPKVEIPLSLPLGRRVYHIMFKW